MSEPDDGGAPVPTLTQALRPLEPWGEVAPPAPDWFLKATSIHPERLKVQVRGAEIEVLSWGRRGDPGLLLAHGARAHAGWWSHIAPLLAKNRRVTVLSWSGMGGSDWRDTYDLDLFAEEAMSAAEASGLFEAPSPPVFLGHSFGGYVMVRAARRHGPRLRRVITLDAGLATFHHPPVPGPTRLYASRAEAMVRFRLEPPQPCWPFIAHWFADKGLCSDGPPEAAFWRWRFDPDVFAKMGEVAIWDDIPEAACPLVFVRSELSKVASPETEARLKDWAPIGSRFVTISGAGHHPMAEDALGLVDLLAPLF